MSHYKSNLRDIEFNLFEVLGRDEVLGTGPFAEVDGETAREVLAEVEADHCLIDCMGVGYVVACGARTLGRMPAPGDEVTLHIESSWSAENGPRLYGFLTRDEREAFRTLTGIQGVGPKAALSVLDVLPPGELAAAVAREDKAAVARANGVGPKLGLAILSGMSAKQFLQVVQHEDVTSLTNLPGIGKKTAERLVVELRDRLAKFTQNLETSGSELLVAGGIDNGGENAIVALSDVKEEAMSALVALGYKPPQASKMVNAVYQDDMDSEALIRQGLKAAL